MIVIELNIVIEGGKRELPCQEVDRQLQMFEDNLIPRLPQPPPVVNLFDGLCQILIMATPPEGNQMLSPQNEMTTTTLDGQLNRH